MDPSEALAYLESKKRKSKQQDEQGLLELFNLRFGTTSSITDPDVR
jgi:hypothetical protein